MVGIVLDGEHDASIDVAMELKIKLHRTLMTFMLLALL